ncbi:hypothetical protein [Vannielia litorea]|uniref:hypothetical protein n=1 Tax=Vannielia litorea TaxID=1217970 RepID=UPI0009411D0C|nr:hypothetical protein [Vannielia litorea]
MAVLVDLDPGSREEVLGALGAAWPGTRRIGPGPDPATEGDPAFWSAVFQTPGVTETPPHGLTLTCTRYGHVSHRALIARRHRGLRPWPGGAEVRLHCEGHGVFWGRALTDGLVRGARAMLETWAVDADPSQPGQRSFRGGDTGPRGGRMVKGFWLEVSPAGGRLPGVVVALEVEIFGF